MAIMTDITKMRIEPKDYLGKVDLEELNSVEEFGRYYSHATHEVIIDGSYTDTVMVFRVEGDPPRF